MKSRSIFLLLCFAFFSFSLKAQSWSAVGAGLTGSVYSMAVYNGELYAGGNFVYAGGVHVKNIARWNGTNWDSVGGGLNSSVWSLCVYNGELYAGGYFDHAGGVYSPHIARWNGTSWNTAGSGMAYSAIFSLAVYNGKLYAGGNFISADGVPVNSIAQWNGNHWDSVGSGVQGPHPIVEAMTVYQGKLIVGGEFTIAGGHPASYIASWNDTSWSSLGPSYGTGASIQSVYALQEYHSKLYAGGVFDTIGNNFVANNLAAWDGNNWQTVFPNNFWYIYSMLSDGPNLYVGDYGLPGNHMAKWNDTVWVSLGGGTSDNVIALTFFNGDLYAAGQFTQAGTTFANRIARWGTPAGENENISTENFSIFPNPSSDYINVVLNTNLFEKTTFTIIDVTGRTVFTKEINFSQNNPSTELDISSLSNGIYMVTVKNGEQLFTKKLIKE